MRSADSLPATAPAEEADISLETLAAESCLLPSADPVRLIGPEGDPLAIDRYAMPAGEVLLKAYRELVIGRSGAPGLNLEPRFAFPAADTRT